MAVVLALVAALMWGTTDFLGGFAARHGSARSVAATATLSGLVSAILVAPLLAGSFAPSDLGWGLGGGFAGGLAILSLYRGFQRGRISIAAPIAAVGTAVFPSLASVAGGDALTRQQYLGIVVCLAAIWFLSSTSNADDRGPVRTSLVYGLLAGIGFGVLLIGIGQIEAEGFAFPLIATRVGSAVALLAPGLITRTSWLAPPRARPWALLGGPIAIAGNIAFFFAQAGESLAIASVLAAMFPAVTVVLAVLVLRERLTRRHLVGLAMALTGIAIIVG